MLCGAAGCSTTPRVESAGLDPAVTATCPLTIASPGALPALHPFDLPDGRTVAPLDEVNARENMLAQGALVLRGGYVQCRSVVIYAEDRDQALAAKR